MAREFTQISIPRETYEDLKKYTEDNCMKMSPFVSNLIKKEIEREKNEVQNKK